MLPAPGPLAALPSCHRERLSGPGTRRQTFVSHDASTGSQQADKPFHAGAVRCVRALTQQRAHLGLNENRVRRRRGDEGGDRRRSWKAATFFFHLFILIF